MKFKSLSIFMAVTLALAFTSCGDKSSDTGNNSNDKENKERIYTGDPIKDARAYVEKSFSLLENAATIEDVEKAEKQDNDMFHELKDAYKDNQQFEKEVIKLLQGEFKERFEKIQERLMNIEQKTSKKKDETMATEEKQAPEQMTEVKETVNEMQEEAVSLEDKLEDF